MQRVTVLLVIAAVALQCCYVPQAAARQLQVPCATVPKCAVKCVPDAITGVTVCPRCEDGYVRWNKGRACVCARGKYDTGSGCDVCGFDKYCPGVSSTYVSTANETPASRGNRYNCDKGVSSDGLMTRKTNTISWKSCLTRPGFRLTSTDGGSITEATQTAVQCTDSTYSEGYARLQTCKSCKPGLAITGLTAAAHDNELDCQVMPGNMWDSDLNRARACPKGSYREGYVDRSNAAALRCTSCGTGISTASGASTARTACRVVVPGYKALWDAQGWAYSASACGYGTYWPGGAVSAASDCTSCGGYTTKNTSSTQLADCMAPPGYYLDSADKTLKRCPNSVAAVDYNIDPAYGTFGTYRPMWATTPKGIKDCKVCGANMLSEYKHGSLNPQDVGNLVAASEDACYIDAGQALNIDYNLQASISTWRVTTCNNATAFGANTRTYGHEALVCKPCGKNLVKNFAAIRNSTDACLNRDGYGLFVDGTFAERCNVGSWAAYGSLLSCTACSSGRTTVYNATLQAAATDCYVVDGYGIYLQSGATDAEKWYETGKPTEAAALAALAVHICPVGRYSNSNNTYGDVGAQCVACPTSSSTTAEGSTAESNCTVCVAGTGRASSTAYGVCSDCGRGTFNDGNSTSIVDGSTRANWECLSCPDTNSTYAYCSSFVDSECQVTALNESNLVSPSTTLDVKSTAVQACVPVNAQIAPYAGTTLFSSAGYNSSELVKTSNDTFEACVAACSADSLCHFSEFRYEKNSTTYEKGCFLFKPAVGSGAIYYKLPPSLTTGLNTTASLASGKYAKYSYDTAITPAWGGDLSAFTTAADAAVSCDGSKACWGFVSTNSTSFVTKTGSHFDMLRTVVNARKDGESGSSASTIIVQP